MNKFTIPAILVATVFVAGIFAFMPVEKAGTVHTTITADLGANIDKKDQVMSFHFMTGTKNLNSSSSANLLPFKDEAWTGNATVIVSDGFATCSVRSAIDGAGDTDGTETEEATVQGTGVSTGDFSAVDRLEVVVDSAMDCTVIVFLDQTKE